MSITRVHVNRHTVQKMHGQQSYLLPCISVVYKSKVWKTCSVLLKTARASHDQRILNCGATAFLETDSSEVEILQGDEWIPLSQAAMGLEEGTVPSKATYHHCLVLNPEIVSEFVFSSRNLKLNRTRAVAAPTMPAIILANQSGTKAVDQNFHFDRPLQIIQSRPGLNSKFFEQVPAFGVGNFTF